MKRYVAEDGSRLVRRVMQEADGWWVCRIGFVETVRAVGMTAGEASTQVVHQEWGSFGVVEVDQALVEHAASLALRHDLRSLDALHLSAALLLPRDELVVATWDRRLHVAARAEKLTVLPEALA